MSADDRAEDVLDEIFPSARKAMNEVIAAHERYIHKIRLDHGKLRGEMNGSPYARLTQAERLISRCALDADALLIVETGEHTYDDLLEEIDALANTVRALKARATQ